MVELGHLLAEPASLATHRGRHPAEAWETLPNSPEKDELRRQLNMEQDGLCIYCEWHIGEDEGHVEHIKSRSVDPQLTFVYDNLAHSCSSDVHCGHKKSDQLLPIEPRPNCSKYFELSVTTGKFAPNRRESYIDQAKADTTLSVLGLNDDPGLVRQRQQYARTVVALEQQSPDDVPGFLATSQFRWSLRRIVA